MAGDDSVRLRHMLDAAREAMELAKGKTRGIKYGVPRIPKFPR